MAKNDKPLRRLKKDAATSSRVVRNKHYLSKPNTKQAIKASKRDSVAFDRISEKSAEEFLSNGPKTKTRNSDEFKAVSAGTKGQYKKDVKTGKIGKPVFGNPNGPRKGVVPGGITKKPKGL